MTLSKRSAVSTASNLIDGYASERDLLDRIDGWLRWSPEPIKTKASSDPEIRYLKDISRTPWARLIVESTAQALTVENIYSASRQPEELRPMWVPWETNRMASRQGQIYRAACGYGYAFATVLPVLEGKMLTPTRKAVITPVSPRQMTVEYGDVIEDEYPQVAMRIIPQGKGRRLLRLIDEDSVHYLSQDDATSPLVYIESRAHGVGYVPVVRYANQMDLEGRAPGEVEPLVPLFARINKTDYDRMLVQHYNSWKIRTATGIDKPSSGSEAETKMKLRQDDILVGGANVNFGTLDETSLKPFIDAHDSDIEALAAASQTPTTAFGKLINVSAEGLQEARASLRAKVGDRKTVFGDAHAQLLRTAARVERRDVDAEDYSVKAKWADTDASYLSSAVDALGKAATMLNVPPRLLWDRIPNVDGPTAESWKKYADEHPSIDEQQAAATIAAISPNE